MGWTYYTATEYRNGKIDRLAECRKEFGRNPEWATILKDAMVGTTYYAALKLSGKDEVFALVCLTGVDKRDFGYKDMDESMNPFYYDCPIGILKLLTPTKNELALEWRATCYKRIKNKKAISKANIIQITFPEHYSGKYYQANDTATLTRYRKSSWLDKAKYIRFNPSYILNLDFTVIE